MWCLIAVSTFRSLVSLADCNMYHSCRAVGATICNRTDELKESDIGTGCGLFEVRKIGDEYFTYLVDCKSPKACTIVLRGASKDILKEVSSEYDEPH